MAKFTWFSIILCFFLDSFAAAQDFYIDLATAPVFPGAAYELAVSYDESVGAIYLAGGTTVPFDGYTLPNKTGSGYCFISRLSSNGSRLWTSIFGGNNDCRVHKLLQGFPGQGIYALGETGSPLANDTSLGSSDSFIVRLALNGTWLLAKLFGTAGADIVNDGFVDLTSQKLVLSGQYNGKAAVTANDMNNGSLLGSIQLGACGTCNALGIARIDLSQCYVTGNTQDLGNDDIFLSKLNYQNGSRSWTRIWGNSSSDYGYDVQFDNSSSLVFVVGRAGGGQINGQAELGIEDALLICASTNGTYLWTRQFGTNSYDVASSLAIHRPSGVIFVAGSFSGLYPGRPNTTISGYVATFSQNGTMFPIQIFERLQNQFEQPTAYTEITFDSTFKTAYFADYFPSFSWLTIGRRSFVTSQLIASSQIQAVTTISTAITSQASPTAIQTTPEFPLMDTTSLVPTTGELYTSSIIPGTTPGTSDNSGGHLLTTSQGAKSVDPVTESPFQTTTLLLQDPAPFLVSLTGSLLIYLLIAVCACLVLTIVVAIACYYRLIKRRDTSFQSSKQSTMSTEALQTAWTTTASKGPDTTTTHTHDTQITSSFGPESATLIRTNFELSLPGFLKFQIINEFRISKELARGGGAVVYQGEALCSPLRVHGASIVIKTVGFSRATFKELGETEQKAFKQEVSLMHFFRDERHIAKLVGWADTPACLLLKFYPLGSLATWMRDTSNAKSKRLVSQFIFDISRGIQAMHVAGFVHFDLKPQNVLVDLDEQHKPFCVLTDFGITRIVEETSLLVKDFAVVKVKGLSIPYASPETFQHFRRHESGQTVMGATEDFRTVSGVDLYAWAIISLELLTRRRPWSS